MSRAKGELQASYPSGYQFCLISYFARPPDREVALQLLGVHMFRCVATILVAILLSAPLVAGITPFPASFHTQMVPTNGTSLYVRVSGKGPAVVLLHGFGDTGDMWAPLALV